MAVLIGGGDPPAARVPAGGFACSILGGPCHTILEAGAAEGNKEAVLFAGLGGAVPGLQIASALDQALTAWQDAAQWHGLAVLGVGVWSACVL